MSREVGYREILKAMFVVIVIVLAVVFWVSKKWNLDLETSAQVVSNHIYFLVVAILVIFLVKTGDLGWATALPASIVGYIACWLPAFNYWASKGDISVLYGNGWIQGSIALIILIGGFKFIRYLEA
jgi:hypothetical protein